MSDAANPENNDGTYDDIIFKREVENLRRILLDIASRGTRHQRGTDEREYLLDDLAYCHLEATEGLERLARIENHR